MNRSRQPFPPGTPPGPRARTGPALTPAGLLIGLLLTVALQLLPVGAWQVDALSFPWTAGGERSAPPADRQSFSGLQEVAPPLAVQQLQAALADREPVVEILSPRDDTLLGAGPWTLRLRVHDWPLVDGGKLGLGPHLVVQLDQEPPRIWTTTEGELPELSPGSHRLTVYAALPWGEARKNPGAVQQIRLHRTAPNPLALPERGSPQLLAVSPPAVAGEEPLLLDVLLLDAPLQNVGGSGTQWRLRLNINGDGVLLDEQTPLWLQGWTSGVNAVGLEWLDGKGDPLNPPFNSLVQEVDRSNPPAAPRWRGTVLSAHELAILLGRIPADPQPALEPAPPQIPTEVDQDAQLLVDGIRPGPSTNALASTAQGTPPGGISAPASAAAMPATPEPGEDTSASGLGNGTAARDAAEQTPVPLIEASEPLVGPFSERDNQAQPMPIAAAGQPQRGSLDITNAVVDPPGSGAQPATSASASLEAQLEPTRPQGGGGNITPARQDREGGKGTQRPGVLGPPASSGSRTAVAGPASTAAAPSSRPPSGIAAADPSSDGSGEQAAATEEPAAAAEDTTATPDTGEALATDDAHLSSTATRAIANSDDGRISPSTSLSGRARDLVNEDGTLKRPERRGPLAALRDRLQG